MQISQRFDYCLSLKYALKLSFHIKCSGKVSGHAGKNAHDMFFTRAKARVINSLRGFFFAQDLVSHAATLHFD